MSRLLLEEGYSPILEFTLPNGRRLDVAAIGPGGEMLGVEIKVALADLRGDGKWPEYLDYCDLFYFAIPPDFPARACAAPDRADRGRPLWRRDRQGGRGASLHASRRKAVTITFAAAPPSGCRASWMPSRRTTLPNLVLPDPLT